MIRRDVVLIDGFLHQPQAEGLGVKRVIARRIGRNGRQMVEAGELHPTTVRNISDSSSSRAVTSSAGSVQLKPRHRSGTHFPARGIARISVLVSRVGKRMPPADEHRVSASPTIRVMGSST
jgi:hypothetical protein